MLGKDAWYGIRTHVLGNACIESSRSIVCAIRVMRSYDQPYSASRAHLRSQGPAQLEQQQELCLALRALRLLGLLQQGGQVHCC